MDLRVLLFVSITTMMVIPQSAFSIEPSFHYSNGTNITNTSVYNLTSSIVKPQVATITRGSQIQLTVIISNSGLQPLPSGTVSWSDGNVGGTFNPTSCTLSSGSCIVSYAPPQSYSGNIMVTTTYGGDNIHSGSTGTSTLTSIITTDVATTITSSSNIVYQGSPVQLIATISDTSSLPTVPSGNVSWNDNNVGGTFNPTSCTLSSGICSVSYTPPQNYDGSIMITTTYGGDSTHNAKSNAGSFTLTVGLLSRTTTAVTPNIITMNQGSQVRLAVAVTDTSSLPSTLSGIVSWSDGNTSGTFNPPTCNLSLGTCSVMYTPSSHPPTSVTVTAAYGGNGERSTSTGTALLTINPLHGTTTSVRPNPVTVAQGSQVKLTATLADVSRSPTAVTGGVLWSDGNAGGTFHASSCTLLFNTCTVYYTPSVYSTNATTITATYGGDNTHSGSFAKTASSIIVLPDSLLLNTDQSYYAYGDVVTLSVNLPGQSLQSIAVGVSNPNGDNIISRTITTDENGTGLMQFKIPDSYQTGVYQDIVTALVDGRNYTNSTEFNVIKSHGIAIDAVQITNQQGKPVSILPKGQNGFVKVSISSGEKMPALLTLNLFDANQSSLGTTSVKSIIHPGSSQMTLSFFIPSNVQVGLANVYTDVYSDWPNNGGTPLAAESCLSADLQDLSTLSVSYVPEQPHSCINSAGGLSSGTGNVLSAAMTSNQAEVTLGVAIQNDSMTFMSPAEAHLLALAFENSTGKNHKNNSVGIVNLNLASLDAKGASTGIINATGVGTTQFTTLVGPDLQNNPMASKILKEIEISKRNVANIIGNQTAAKLDQQLVLQQRQAAASQLKQALNTLANASASTTPDIAYAHFLTTVNYNKTIPVFQAEFNFMKQRVAVANAAMQSVLSNGGSLGQALASFDKYATINHVQMVSLNSELNVAYGLADSRIQSCFDSKGQITVVNGVNPCIKNIEDNSTGPNGISIISVQATDHQGNPVSMLTRGQTGYIKVVLASNVNTQSLVTVNLFDSNISSLGTASAQYTLSPGQSEVILPYYVSGQSGTGLASLYANVFTDWPNKGGTSQSNELSYFVGLS